MSEAAAGAKGKAAAIGKHKKAAEASAAELATARAQIASLESRCQQLHDACVAAGGESKAKLEARERVLEHHRQLALGKEREYTTKLEELDGREADLSARAEAAEERELELSRREEAVDAREDSLDSREAELLAREADAADADNGTERGELRRSAADEALLMRRDAQLERALADLGESRAAETDAKAEADRAAAAERAREVELHRTEQKLRSAEADGHKKELMIKALQMELQRGRENYAPPGGPTNTDDVSGYAASSSPASADGLQPEGARGSRSAGFAGGHLSLRQQQHASRLSAGLPARAPAPAGLPPRPRIDGTMHTSSVGTPPAHTRSSLGWVASPLQLPLTPASPLVDPSEAGDVSELLAACNAYVDNIVSENQRMRSKLLSCRTKLGAPSQPSQNHS